MGVFIVSDLHLGHKSILKHIDGFKGGPGRGGVKTVEEHDEWVINQCLSAPGVNKHTYWWFLGDVCMDITQLHLINQLPGRKILILGNHDKFQTAVYLKYFHTIVGACKKYGMWLSHIPIHPAELRGKVNVHGHCHHDTLGEDPRYFNAAIEWLPQQRPINLDVLREHFNGTTTGEGLSGQILERTRGL